MTTLSDATVQECLNFIIKKAINLESAGSQYVEEFGQELLVVKVKEKTAEEWNERARITNSKVFSEHFGRKPECYEEVLNWMESLFENKEIPSAGNTEDHS